MADYPIISDVSSYIVKLLRKKMCPEPIPSPNNIEVSSPADQDDDYILGLYLYDIRADVALQTSCEKFSYNLSKETALKRVLSNLLSAVSLLRFKAVFSCGFRVPPGSGLYQSCAAGSVCIPAGQKYCSPRPRKSCPADRKTPGLPSRCIGHRW